MSNNIKDRNLKPETLDPKPETCNQKLETLKLLTQHLKSKLNSERTKAQSTPKAQHYSSTKAKSGLNQKQGCISVFLAIRSFRERWGLSSEALAKDRAFFVTQPQRRSWYFLFHLQIQTEASGQKKVQEIQLINQHHPTPTSTSSASEQQSQNPSITK